MKKIIYVLLILFTFTHAFSADKPKIKLDVKTPVSEITSADIAKSGLISIIAQSPVVEGAEFTEDYAVWIRDFVGKVDGNKYVYYCWVELKTSPLIGSGDSLYSRFVRDTIMIPEKMDYKDYESEKIAAKVENELKSSGETTKFATSLAKLGINLGTGGWGVLINGVIGYASDKFLGSYTARDVYISTLIGVNLYTNTIDMMVKKKIL